MATYVFGGGPVQPSNVSYISINLNANITLSWPISYLDTSNVLGQITDVVPDAGGRVLTLPDARIVAPGTSFAMNNRSGHAFTLNRADGTLLQNFAAGTFLFFYLIDSRTLGGTWITTPFGAGVGVVTSVNAVSTSPATLGIAGVPIVDAGTITFTPGAELVGLQAIGGSGYVVRTGAGAYAHRLLTLPVGSNLVLTNADGIAGNTSISLATAVAGLISLTSTQVQAGNLQLLGNSISASNLNGDVTIIPNGIGSPRLGALAYPTNDFGRLGYIPISTGANRLNMGRIAANNLIINGAFQIWDSGNTYSISNGYAYTVDRWQLVSDSDVLANVVNASTTNQLAAAFGREAGDNHIGTITFGQTMTIDTCAGAASANFVSFSFIASKGLGFSGAASTVAVKLITGTGNADVSALQTGFTGAVTVTNNVVLTNIATLYKFTVDIANNVTQIALAFSYVSNNIAANDDYVVLSEVQLNLGSSVSAFEHIDASIVSKQCAYYLYSDFSYGTFNTDGVGLNTGETIVVASKAGALANSSTFIAYPAMRINNPNIFLYNPVNNNDNAYDEDLGADCGVPTVLSKTNKGFNVTIVGNAGTAIGNRIGFHYLIDAELH